MNILFISSLLFVGAITGWVACSICAIKKIDDERMYYINVIQELEKKLRIQSKLNKRNN